MIIFPIFNIIEHMETLSPMTVKPEVNVIVPPQHVDTNNWIKKLIRKKKIISTKTYISNTIEYKK